MQRNRDNNNTVTNVLHLLRRVTHATSAPTPQPYQVYVRGSSRHTRLVTDVKY